MYINELGILVDGDKQSGWREATQEEIDNYFLGLAKEQTKINALEKIKELEAQAIRPLRAITLGTDTEYDRTKLSGIEAEIQTLREGLNA